MPDLRLELAAAGSTTTDTSAGPFRTYALTEGNGIGYHTAAPTDATEPETAAAPQPEADPAEVDTRLQGRRWIEWGTLGQDHLSQRDLASRHSAWYALAAKALERVGTAQDPYRRPGNLLPSQVATEAARRLLSKAALVELPEPFRIHATAAGGIAIRFHEGLHWFLIECYDEGGQTATWENWTTKGFDAWVLGEEIGRRSEDELLDQIKTLAEQVER